MSRSPARSCRRRSRTIEELLERGGQTLETVHHEILRLSADAPPAGHVFSLDAEQGAAQLAPVLERLIDGWRILGYEIGGLRALAESLEPKGLGHYAVEERVAPDRAGRVAVQGLAFLAEDGEVAQAIDSRNNAVATAADEETVANQPGKETVKDFSLPMTGGGTFRLKDADPRFVVLYFYPKDNTPGCTTEGLQFRESHKTSGRPVPRCTACPATA